MQTLDFFTPVVDDPYSYGAIAAANSLSDVYAMGGSPMTAMAICCFPEKGVDLEILVQIMTGGIHKLREAGVTLLGGHTVTDPEIKFGYSVTGIVHPGRIITNAGARPGDCLVLTKPLGIGIVTSGIKSQKSSAAAAKEAVAVMSQLNRTAAEVMLSWNARAATDITGNGLLGHAHEVALASRVALRIEADKVPYIKEAYSLAEAGTLPRSIKTTREMIQSATEVNPAIPKPLIDILLDPQTSGGLLISVGRTDLNGLLQEMAEKNVQAVMIGEVEELQGARIRVV